MRFLKHVLAALSLGFVALVAGAAPANPQNGVDYRTLDKPQQTDSGKKVEVTEFFWYSCPHCFALDPELEAWVKKQGDKINFRRVPVAFRDSMVPQQKMFYALEAMGKGEELHRKIFNTIHAQRQPLDSESQIVDFLTKQGVDKQKFLETYNSFTVQTKAQRAKQLQNAYNIDGVPLLAVEGRYMTSPSIVSASMGNVPESALAQGTFQVMDWLVAKAAKEMKGEAAPAKGK
ncbi:thiol:disulfide interchange protein DsbA/DsbL [Noviherbaspirillum galbum]|uniref:Thiol:disulfide interchange protein DsbA n=1 Tax=Noviherbaspirillum galbum TaxID=2709383 RepID=A0A6B3SV58_9BURK|nr:thiol:disulfide interchange protein DsbA/DsbL [Noviherbaspirillum galbum]NEX63265.1 thiol:disulfide interchange protein DsbA/DsbL [Noviherbaspirillum galbum]